MSFLKIVRLICVLLCHQVWDTAVDWRCNSYGAVKKYNVAWLGILVHESMRIDDNIKMNMSLWKWDVDGTVTGDGSSTVLNVRFERIRSLPEARHPPPATAACWQTFAHQLCSCEVQFIVWYNSNALSDRDESIRRFAVDCLSRSCHLYHQPSLMYRWRVRQKQKPTEKERMETWKGTAAALTAVLATFYKPNSVQLHT
jgi:hypothetical protein